MLVSALQLDPTLITASVTQVIQEYFASVFFLRIFHATKVTIVTHYATPVYTKKKRLLVYNVNSHINDNDFN